MTEKIPLNQFVNAVRDVLKERGPDYVYEPPEPATCVYGVVDDKGEVHASCLYGAVFIEKLNLSYQPDWEQASLHELIDEFVESEDLDLYDEDAESSLIDVFNSTQSLQDLGERYAVVETDLEDGLENLGLSIPRQS